jgi:DNA-binding HxlR family transcriptional regulator
MARRATPDLLPGTLDLLILRTLRTEALHGWAISERIQQISGDVLQINQGSLYPALHRLEDQGWIECEEVGVQTPPRPATKLSPSRTSTTVTVPFEVRATSSSIGIRRDGSFSSASLASRAGAVPVGATGGISPGRRVISHSMSPSRRVKGSLRDIPAKPAARASCSTYSGSISWFRASSARGRPRLEEPIEPMD